MADKQFDRLIPPAPENGDVPPPFQQQATLLVAAEHLNASLTHPNTTCVYCILSLADISQL